MELNVKLLEQVRDAILANPKHITMPWWIVAKYGTTPTTPADCGTVCCVAGWASYLAAPKAWPKRAEVNVIDPHNAAIPDHAQKRLRLTDEEASALFDSLGWPYKFQSELRLLNPGTKAYAKVVAARIDWFIEHGE